MPTNHSPKYEPWLALLGPWIKIHGAPYKVRSGLRKAGHGIYPVDYLKGEADVRVQGREESFDSLGGGDYLIVEILHAGASC
jgi:hypothetical protein